MFYINRLGASPSLYVCYLAYGFRLAHCNPYLVTKNRKPKSFKIQSFMSIDEKGKCMPNVYSNTITEISLCFYFETRFSTNH